MGFVQVNFLPLDIRDEEDVALVLHHADYIVQYGEDLEPKQPKDDVSFNRLHYAHCQRLPTTCKDVDSSRATAREIIPGEIPSSFRTFASGDAECSCVF